MLNVLAIMSSTFLDTEDMVVFGLGVTAPALFEVHLCLETTRQNVHNVYVGVALGHQLVYWKKSEARGK